MARNLVAFSLVAATLSFGTTGAAQDEPEEVEATMVDHTETYQRAARRASRNDISGSIELFRSITEDDPYWSDVYFNMGQLAPRIGNNALCVTSLRRYLYLEPEAEDASTVLRDIEDCERHIETLGHLEVSSTTPSNLAVAIDGLILGEGSIATMGLPAGPHTISATRTDYVDFEQVVTIVEGETISLAVDMTGVTYTGEMVFTVNQPGATIVVDGVQIGVAPIAEPLVRNEGRYLVEVSLDGYYPWQRYMVIDRDDPALVEANLISTDVDLCDLQ